MQLSNLVFAGVCGIVGLVAGRATRSAPVGFAAAPPPFAPPQRPIHAPTIEVAATAGDEDIDEDIDDDGEDIAVAISAAKGLANQQFQERDAIRGHVRNSRDGTPLVGCAVTALGATDPAQTVITDENGNYQIFGLDTASYTVAIYYGGATAETTGVATRSYEVTNLDLGLAYPPDPDPEPDNDLGYTATNQSSI